MVGAVNTLLGIFSHMGWLGDIILGLNVVAILAALLAIVRIRLARRREDHQDTQDHEEGGQ